MLHVENLCFAYGRHVILRGLTFEVQPGEILAILGPNGAGKTTLVKSVGWCFAPTAGTVRLDGTDIRLLCRNRRAQLIGYVPQQSSIPDVSVYQAVLVGRTPYLHWGAARAKDHEVVIRILSSLDLLSLAKRRTSTLSGGQLQQVIIARALAQEPQVLLLDEPINHLDLHNRLQVLELIGRVTREWGMHTVIVIHDINTALDFADRFLLIKDGAIIRWGDASVITAEAIEQTFAVSVRMHFLDNRRLLLSPPRGT
jgi:iron complex transport system ATP-binding protein